MEVSPMTDNSPSFKSGDKVRIKVQNTIQYGEVISTTTLKTGSGDRELVWVKLVGGKVDGFSAQNLEKMRAFPKRYAA
jgi:hypothetical protein